MNAVNFFRCSMYAALLMALPSAALIPFSSGEGKCLAYGLSLAMLFWAALWAGFWLFALWRRSMMTSERPLWRRAGQLITRGGGLLLIGLCATNGYLPGVVFFICFQLPLILIIFGCSKEFARDVPDAKDPEKHQETP